jgi:hypothetical protein
VAAAFPDKLNGGSEAVEDDIVSMFPELPQAEEAKSGGRARRSGWRDAASSSRRDLAMLLRLRSDRAPKLTSEAATKLNMACSL